MSTENFYCGNLTNDFNFVSFYGAPTDFSQMHSTGNNDYIKKWPKSQYLVEYRNDDLFGEDDLLRLYFDIDCHDNPEHKLPYSLIDMINILKDYFTINCQDNYNGEPIFSIMGYVTNKQALDDLLNNEADNDRNHKNFKFPYMIWLADDESLRTGKNPKLMSFHVVIINKFFTLKEFYKCVAPMNTDSFNKPSLQMTNQEYFKKNIWIDTDGTVYKTKTQAFRFMSYNKPPSNGNSIIKSGCSKVMKYDFNQVIGNFAIGKLPHSYVDEHNLYSYRCNHINCLSTVEVDNNKILLRTSDSDIVNNIHQEYKSDNTNAESAKTTNEASIEASETESSKSSTKKSKKSKSSSTKYTKKSKSTKVSKSADKSAEDSKADDGETESNKTTKSSKSRKDLDITPIKPENIHKMYQYSDEAFNKTYSIFELCGCSVDTSRYNSIKCILYKYEDSGLCITMKDLVAEIKLWFDKRDHNIKWSSYEQKILKKYHTDYRCDIREFYGSLMKHAREAIYKGVTDQCKIYNYIELLDKSFKLHKNLTNKEVNLLRQVQSKLELDYIEGEELPDYATELIECRQKWNEINRDKYMSDRNMLFQKFKVKLNGILSRYLQERYYEIGDTQGMDNVCYLKDNETYFYKGITRSANYIEHEFGKLGFNPDYVPQFDNQDDMTYSKLLYQCNKQLMKDSSLKIDIKKWLSYFRLTFDDDKSYNIYLSWFHYKLNGERLRLNLLNCGAKNCLKSAFVKNMQNFFKISADLSIAQFMDKFNGDILSNNIIYLDEVEGCNDMDAFRENLKRMTTSDKLSTENKNVKQYNVTVKFDIIINTNNENKVIEILGTDADTMLKRFRVIKRIQLTAEQLNNPEFINIESNPVFQYQLYDYIKNVYNKEDGLLTKDEIFNLDGKNNLDYETELLNSQKGNASLNNIDDELYNNIFNIFKKISDKKDRYKINISYFRDNFCKSNWRDMYSSICKMKANEVNAFIKKDTGMELDSNGRCNLKEIDKFINKYTEYATLNELKAAMTTSTNKVSTETSIADIEGCDDIVPDSD